MKLRLLLCTLLSGATACHPASAAPAAPAFDPGAVVPYFATGPGAEALRRLHAGDAHAAAQFFSAYLEKDRKAKDRDPARFFLALSQLSEKAPASPAAPAAPAADPLHEDARRPAALPAARAFDQLAGEYKLLASYHRLYAARAYLYAGKPQEALDRAEKVPADSVLACEARFLRGEALRRLQRSGPAIAELAAYQTQCTEPGQSAHANEAAARLGELYAAAGQPDDAIRQWRRLYLTAPTETWGSLAGRHLEVDQVPAEQRRFTAHELLGRAMILFDNMRNPESEIAFRQILEAPAAELPDRDDDLTCVAKFHLAQSVFKQRQRPRAAPLFLDAAPACEKAKNDDLHMKALYQAARCHGSKGELQAAADLFEKAEAAHPGHSYADDARVRQAEMYADLAEKLVKQGPKATCGEKSCPDYDAKITALLSALPDRYPGGDQRAEALWRLAFRAYRKGDLRQARSYLSDSLRRVPRETGWDQEGRTLYWLGRVAELERRDKDAHDLYRRAALEYPLSFYCLLSLNRLRERDPQELSRFLTEISREPPEEAGQAEWRFAPRPLFSEPGFLRAVELMRLGLGPEARQELSALGIKVPEGQAAKTQKVTSPEQEELLWLSAVLYDRAGQRNLSHWIPRHTLTAYQRHYPVGTWRKQWLLSYPRGYEDLLAEAARATGQPLPLQLAIVREESAFDPLNESFANAIGLTQMIPPTAKRFSAGLPTTREALRDPAINVAIGGRFLGFLWSTMQGNPALSIAGYNAGEGAVFRWLAARGDLDMDAWVESIPYDETRGYTKRVLSSFLAYSWLYPDGGEKGAAADLGDRIPRVTLKLPALPQVKRGDAREEDPHRK